MKPAGHEVDVTQSEKSVSGRSGNTREDLLVSLCGFVSSLFTGIALWWVEKTFGFSFYTLMYWFVVPVGAFLSGFAGASGYFAGSWFFGHRPTRLLLLNVVLASVCTFFLVHYLSYATMEIDGKSLSEYIPFIQYLDIVTTSMEFRLRGAKLGSTGNLGGFGYFMALLQIGGFAVGGFAVYRYLVSLPYCGKCSQYLSSKGKQVRYTGDAEGLTATAAQIIDQIRNGGISALIVGHGTFGFPKCGKGHYLCSVFEVRHCKKCETHWVKFCVQKESGNDWEEVRGLHTVVLTDEIISI